MEFPTSRLVTWLSGYRAHHIAHAETFNEDFPSSDAYSHATILIDETLIESLIGVVHRAWLTRYQGPLGVIALGTKF